MIVVTGLADIPGFIRDLDLAFAELDREISAHFEAFTHKLFADLVSTTPQWTGDLASAWNFSIAYPDETYTPIPNKIENNQHWSKADVHHRGDDPAVSSTIAKAMGVHPTWRDVVYMHNPAPIAEQVENLRVLIRPVNLVDGRVAMVDYYTAKYANGGSW